jgi:chromosome partitioning protein
MQNDLEEFVAEYFEKQKLQVIRNEGNRKYIHLVITDGKIKLGVHIKDWAKPLPSSEISNLQEFLSTKEGKSFSGVLLVGRKEYGFAKSTLAAKNNIDEPNKIQLMIYDRNNSTLGIYDESDETTPPLQKQVHISVCTCKGGVGKTTVAAHLSGALTLLGYQVALGDADPHMHLLNLLDPEREGVILGKNKIECFSINEYMNSTVKKEQCQFVIYDCAPNLESNKKEIYEQSDFALIPINLCPLGIGKNKRILKETFDYIKVFNKSIKCLTLVNNEIKSQDEENAIARSLREELTKGRKTTSMHLLPKSIRHSEHLYY